MHWKYFQFESKLLLHNRKNGFLGLVLLLFFILFFHQFSSADHISLLDKKRNESSMYTSLFNQLPETMEETPQGAEVYESLKSQSTLVNFQVFYLTRNENEAYMENGFELTELRLRVHELGNIGIPEHLIIPKEDIWRDDAHLSYIEEHNLPLREEPVTASRYLVAAITTLSGLFFYMFVLLCGSEILSSEQRHRTVISGFPISFLSKINSKVAIYSLHIFSFLIGGIILGGFYATNESSKGNFINPVLIYLNGNYEAISTTQFLLYIVVAMVIVTILTLYLSVLLNMIFNNAFANLLIGLALFVLPDVVRLTGTEATWLQPIKYLDFTSVLTGDLAIQFGNSNIDYWHMILSLCIMTFGIICIIFLIHQFSYMKKFNRPHSKANRKEAM